MLRLLLRVILCLRLSAANTLLSGSSPIKRCRAATTGRNVTFMQLKLHKAGSETIADFLDSCTDPHPNGICGRYGKLRRDHSLLRAWARHGGATLRRDFECCFGARVVVIGAVREPVEQFISALKFWGPTEKFCTALLEGEADRTVRAWNDPESPEHSAVLHSYNADQANALCLRSGLTAADLPWLEAGFAPLEYRPDELTDILFSPHPPSLPPPSSWLSGPSASEVRRNELPPNRSLVAARVLATFDEVASTERLFPFFKHLQRRHADAGLRGCNPLLWNTHGFQPSPNRSVAFPAPFLAAVRHRLRWSIAAWEAVRAWEIAMIPDANRPGEWGHQYGRGRSGRHQATSTTPGSRPGPKVGGKGFGRQFGSQRHRPQSPTGNFPQPAPKPTTRRRMV